VSNSAFQVPVLIIDVISVKLHPQIDAGLSQPSFSVNLD